MVVFGSNRFAVTVFLLLVHFVPIFLASSWWESFPWSSSMSSKSIGCSTFVSGDVYTTTNISLHNCLSFQKGVDTLSLSGVCAHGEKGNFHHTFHTYAYISYFLSNCILDRTSRKCYLSTKISPSCYVYSFLFSGICEEIYYRPGQPKLIEFSDTKDGNYTFGRNLKVGDLDPAICHLDVNAIMQPIPYKYFLASWGAIVGAITNDDKLKMFAAFREGAVKFFARHDVPVVKSIVKAPRKVLFLTRCQEKSKARCILHGQATVDRLQSQLGAAFDVQLVENLLAFNERARVQLFLDAAVVIGVHGAWVPNVMFMNQPQALMMAIECWGSSWRMWDLPFQTSMLKVVPMADLRYCSSMTGEQRYGGNDFIALSLQVVGDNAGVNASQVSQYLVNVTINDVAPISSYILKHFQIPT